jgi:hypothetical protein
MHAVTFSFHLYLTEQVECSSFQHFQSEGTLWASSRVLGDGRLDTFSL